MAGEWVEITKLVVEGGGFALAIVTAWLGLEKAHQDRQEALEQAKRDLQWRQTLEAQSAVRRLVSDTRAQNAMTMLDWDGRSFDISPGHSEPISWDERRVALRISPDSFAPKEVFIRDCFDGLFDQFQMIQQEINNKLFDVEYVHYPIGYFSNVMRNPEDWPIIHAFLTTYGYPLAEKLIATTYQHSNAGTDVHATPRVMQQ